MLTAVLEVRRPRFAQGDREVRELLEQALTHCDGVAAHAFLVRARRLVGVDARKPVAPNALNHWWEEIGVYIDRHLEARINVERLAAISGHSVSHFHRLFRERSGIAPGTYIRQRRVRRAQELMRMPKARLVDVALECGFADQAHLSRVFRQVVGMNPRAWRVACSHFERIDG